MSCPRPKKEKLVELTVKLLQLIPPFAISDILDEHTDIVTELMQNADIDFDGSKINFKAVETFDLASESTTTLNKIIQTVVNEGFASNEELDKIFDEYGFEPMKPNLARPVKH